MQTEVLLCMFKQVSMNSELELELFIKILVECCTLMHR